MLGSTPLRAVGVVSYGVYVYHFFVQGLVDIGSGRYLGAPLPPALRLFVLVSATLAFAAVSWFILERPARAWGRRFRRASGA